MMGTRNPNHYSYFQSKKEDEVVEATIEVVEEVKEPVIEISDELNSKTDFKDMKKAQQVALLKKFGLTNKEIKALKNEDGRVAKLVELVNEE